MIRFVVITRNADLALVTYPEWKLRGWRRYRGYTQEGTMFEFVNVNKFSQTSVLGECTVTYSQLGLPVTKVVGVDNHLFPYTRLLILIIAKVLSILEF